jgi:hypothetical protein
MGAENHQMPPKLTTIVYMADQGSRNGGKGSTVQKFYLEVTKVDTFIFYHVGFASFARILRPIEMYLLTFSGSYAP